MIIAKENPGTAGGRPWVSETDFVASEIFPNTTSSTEYPQASLSIPIESGMPILARHWPGFTYAMEGDHE